MTIGPLPLSTGSLSIINCDGAGRRTIASYKRRLTAYRRTKIHLRQALARDDVMLRQVDELTKNQAHLDNRSDYKLLNDLQAIVNLLPLQTLVLTNAEVTFAEHQTSERA